jgi:hypothetical protein
MNLNDNSIFVLSTNKDKIIFPKILVDDSVLINPQTVFNNLLKSYLPSIDEVQFFAQFIKLHHNQIDNDTNTINSIYGFLVDYSSNIKDSFWIQFNIGDKIPYHDLLLEVIQQLK